jgi:hypothetical protein
VRGEDIIFLTASQPVGLRMGMLSFEAAFD